MTDEEEEANGVSRIPDLPFHLIEEYRRTLSHEHLNRSELVELVKQYEQALATRVVIEQAKGWIAALRDVTLDEAFFLIRSYSRSHNKKIHDVARLVVTKRLML